MTSLAALDHRSDHRVSSPAILGVTELALGVRAGLRILKATMLSGRRLPVCFGTLQSEDDRHVARRQVRFSLASS